MSNFHLQEIETLQNSLREREKYVTELEAHIKRLEEAGDKAILNSYLPDRLAVWNEAKEDKL